MIYIWGITDKGAVRAQNQDSFYIKQLGPELVSALVCDGMGGALAGDVASSLAIEVASAYLESLSEEELRQVPGEHLTRGAKLANGAVYQRAIRDSQCRGMGTTMVSVIMDGVTARILNIGDSRAYRISEEGIIKVTRDHSVVEDLVTRGEITREEARLHPKKNLITRCLGTEEKAETDLYEVTVREGEFLLLCTDGLSNILTDQEILYEVIHGGEPESCCQRLLNQALSKGAPDNVTAVLIQKV